MTPVPVTAARSLLLLRHAKTEDFKPGGRDSERQLTAEGQSQAVAVGDWLRAESLSIDTVLCSTATRARQTLASLEIDAPVDFLPGLYDAGTDTIIETIGGLSDHVTTALVVGHAPAIPSTVAELSDPASSDPAALAAVEHRFPPATLALLRFTGPWSALSEAALVSARLPADP